MALLLWKFWTIYTYDAKKAFQELVVLGLTSGRQWALGFFF
jgi:hypothetical protein